MSKKRWFRFHIDKWFAGTFGLSPNEIAAYVTIICELYDHDGYVRLNERVMSRRCGMRPTSFRKAVDSLVLAGKLNIERGFLTNRAVTEEIISREKLGQKSKESREKRTENGNDFNENPEKTPHKQNTENKYTSSSDVVALHPGSGFGKIAPDPSALARFNERRNKKNLA